jgi:hypothetical protein
MSSHNNYPAFSVKRMEFVKISNEVAGGKIVSLKWKTKMEKDK